MILLQKPMDLGARRARACFLPATHKTCSCIAFQESRPGLLEKYMRGVDFRTDPMPIDREGSADDIGCGDGSLVETLQNRMLHSLQRRVRQHGRQAVCPTSRSFIELVECRGIVR